MKLISRFFAVTASLFLLLPAFALEKEDQLAKFAKAIEGRRVSATFTASFDYANNFYSKDGSLIYQSGLYFLRLGDLSFYNDGKSQWALDMENRELVIDNAVKIDFLSNSNNLPSMFGVNDPLGVSVKYSSSTSYPESITISLRRGESIYLKISDIKITNEGPSEDFSFDPWTLPANWFVTDLRQE